MKHFVNTSGPGRIAVVYMIPGTAVASVVRDYPRAASFAAHQQAEDLTAATAPRPDLPPPAERRIPPGFYADQGALF